MEEAEKGGQDMRRVDREGRGGIHGLLMSARGGMQVRDGGGGERERSEEQDMGGGRNWSEGKAERGCGSGDGGGRSGGEGGRLEES